MGYHEMMAVALDAGEEWGAALEPESPLWLKSGLEIAGWMPVRASGRIALLPHGIAVGLLDEGGEWFVGAYAVAREKGPHGPWRNPAQVR